jgi:NhaP-type Na+/H+ or K+/H+ antiporter
MSLAEWSLFVGALLVTMVLAGTLLGRLPLSSAMVYLALGWLLVPTRRMSAPGSYLHAGLLERLAEIALLISLFAVGLRLGCPCATVAGGCRCGWLSCRWHHGGAGRCIGVWVLGLPVGAAVLLGAVLAPTDPVLASGVQSDPGSHPERLGSAWPVKAG